MVEWLAGNRIRGTSAEKPVLGLQSPSVGGWVEVGRTTLGSSGDDIDISSLADKRYYMVLCSDLPTGNTQWYPRLGNGSFDTSNNYATRESYNGATDGVNPNQPSIRWNTSITASYTNPKFGVGYISNLATKEKLTMFHGVAQQSAGAGTSPYRAEVVSKWTNTSNVMDMFRLHNIESGSFNTGSEVVVLGWDPADTHTTNFWEELASVTTTGAGTSISSGTFTAKKYIWFQMYAPSGQSAIVDNFWVRFNGDSGSNYARRYSNNGGTDGTATSDSKIQISRNGKEGDFMSAFIVNNSANEKLLISHSISVGDTLGAGAVPNRGEIVGKWTNTSSQITSIVVSANADSIPAGWIIKVWGSD